MPSTAKNYVPEVNHSHRHDFQRRTPISSKTGISMQIGLPVPIPKIRSVLTLNDSFNVKSKVKRRGTLKRLKNWPNVMKVVSNDSSSKDLASKPFSNVVRLDLQGQIQGRTEY